MTVNGLIVQTYRLNKIKHVWSVDPSDKRSHQIY